MASADQVHVKGLVEFLKAFHVRSGFAHHPVVTDHQPVLPGVVGALQAFPQRHLFQLAAQFQDFRKILRADFRGPEPPLVKPFHQKVRHQQRQGFADGRATHIQDLAQVLDLEFFTGRQFADQDHPSDRQIGSLGGGRFLGGVDMRLNAHGLIISIFLTICQF